jgi:hypothetical protein
MNEKGKGIGIKNIARYAVEFDGRESNILQIFYHHKAT